MKITVSGETLWELTLTNTPLHPPFVKLASTLCDNKTSSTFHQVKLLTVSRQSRLIGNNIV